MPVNVRFYEANNLQKERLWISFIRFPWSHTCILNATLQFFLIPDLTYSASVCEQCSTCLPAESPVLVAGERDMCHFGFATINLSGKLLHFSAMPWKTNSVRYLWFNSESNVYIVIYLAYWLLFNLIFDIFHFAVSLCFFFQANVIFLICIIRILITKLHAVSTDEHVQIR